MDETDRIIIDLLAADSRRSLADIGAHIGLAPSSVNERIRRLVDAGVIRRFTVETDPVSLGLPILVFVWIALREDADEAAFRAHATSDPAILECHHVTGPWSYLLKLRLPAIEGIEEALARLKATGFLARSETVLALSSAVPGAHVPAARP